MLSYAFVALSGFTSVVVSKPLESTKLVPRNPCDGINAEPALYHQYGTDICPPKYSLKDDGTCPYMNHIENDCAAFCEMRTQFQYGQEQPFASTYCHGPLTCSITSTHTRTVAWTVTIAPKFLEGIKIGTSGGYSENTADAVARAFSVKLDEGSCGYFTFVPITKTACGTMSTQNVVTVPGGALDCDGDAQLTGNFCADQLKLNGDGKSDGDTIFVKTDCGTRMPLDPSKQDPAYQKPGVPLDRGTAEAWAAVWADTDSISASSNDVKCETSDASPAMDDCIHAFNSLVGSPGVGVLHGKKDGTWWAAYVHTCAIAIYYETDWDDSCDATLGDVALYAYQVSDKCANGGNVGGQRPFKTDKCASHIEIIHTDGQPPQGGF